MSVVRKMRLFPISSENPEGERREFDASGGKADKEFHSKERKHFQSYVTNYFGRPLEKLNIFFEGVQARIDTGTKRSDVCFIHQYSKSELRKVIKEFPGREVKRGLEALYK